MRLSTWTFSCVLGNYILFLASSFREKMIKHFATSIHPKILFCSWTKYTVCIEECTAHLAVCGILVLRILSKVFSLFCGKNRYLMFEDPFSTKQIRNFGVLLKVAFFILISLTRLSTARVCVRLWQGHVLALRRRKLQLRQHHALRHLRFLRELGRRRNHRAHGPQRHSRGGLRQGPHGAEWRQPDQQLVRQRVRAQEVRRVVGRQSEIYHLIALSTFIILQFYSAIVISQWFIVPIRSTD